MRNIKLFSDFFTHLTQPKGWLYPTLLALLGAVLMYKGIARYKDKLGYDMEAVKILISSQGLPQGHLLSKQDVSIGHVPKKYVPIGVIKALDKTKVMGHALLRPVAKGEMILWSALDVEYAPLSPARRIAKGYRAIAVQVDSKTSIGQSIRPGDHVDILATLLLPGEEKPQTLTLLQNVSVLAVGSAISSELDTAYSTISLMVLPKEVGIILHGELHGRLGFALRHPDDHVTHKDLPLVSADQLAETGFRNSIQVEHNDSIEIIRGGKTIF